MDDNKKDLVVEMYSVIASATSELERLEDIMQTLQSLEDDNDLFNQLIIMKTSVMMFRRKFSVISKSIMDKKFNIVEMAKRKSARIDG